MFNSWTPGCEGPIQALAETFAYLETLKARLDRARPLPPVTAESLHQDLALRYTYNSNAIEGNSLTLIETKVVLEHGLTCGGKPLKDHLEVIGHQEAIGFIEALSQSPAPLDERTLKDIHSLVLRGVDHRNAGRWRDRNVFISGAKHTPPDIMQVPEKMEEFFDWCAGEAARKLSTIERAARIHADFVNIHPFIDGNGRTARLIMNLELIKAGFPLAILPVEERFAYYDALEIIATTGDYVPFVSQVAALVDKGFEPYSIALGYDQGVALDPRMLSHPIRS